MPNGTVTHLIPARAVNKDFAEHMIEWLRITDLYGAGYGISRNDLYTWCVWTRGPFYDGPESVTFKVLAVRLVNGGPRADNGMGDIMYRDVTLSTAEPEAELFFTFSDDVPESASVKYVVMLDYGNAVTSERNKKNNLIGNIEIVRSFEV